MRKAAKRIGQRGGSHVGIVQSDDDFESKKWSSGTVFLPRTIALPTRAKMTADPQTPPPAKLLRSEEVIAVTQGSLAARQPLG